MLELMGFTLLFEREVPVFVRSVEYRCRTSSTFLKLNARMAVHEPLAAGHLPLMCPVENSSNLFHQKKQLRYDAQKMSVLKAGFWETAVIFAYFTLQVKFGRLYTLWENVMLKCPVYPKSFKLELGMTQLSWQCSKSKVAQTVPVLFL